MTEAPPPRPAARLRNLARPLLLIGAVAALLTIAKVFGLGEQLGALRDWIDGLGAWGPVVYIGLYIVAVVVAIPGSAITLAAGAIFGSVWGVVLVSVASTSGATLAFLISRYFAREAVSRWLSRSERFTRLDAMTERHGAIIVAVTRLVPLFPFNLLNYGFGLTRVHLGTYVFWSWLCMLPGTVFFVVGADVLFTALSGEDFSWKLAAALAAALVVMLLLAWVAGGYLKRKEMDGDG